MSAENKTIARRFVEEVWGKGDLELSNKLLAPECIDHNPGPGLTPDREGHNQLLLRVRTAFPNARFTLDDVLAEGDRVVDRWTMDGLHAGPFAGVPPTGRAVRLTGMDILRIENGRVVELWHLEDTQGLMQQLRQAQPPDPQSAEGQALRLENVNHQIASLLRRPQVIQRLRAAGPDEWSAVQVLGHMIELIGYWMRDARLLAAATGTPPHFGRTLDAPERLEAVQHGATSDPEELWRELDGVIRIAATDIRGMTPAQRAQKGLHSRVGEISVADAIETLIVAHVENHLRQIKQVLGTPD